MKKLLTLITIVLLFGFVGCREGECKKNETLEKSAEMKLAVSAKFLQSDGSWYLTEQRQEISYSPKAIKITAKEPFGIIYMSVKNGQFSLRNSPANGFDNQAFELMTDESICKGLLAIYLAQSNNTPNASGQIIKAPSEQAGQFMYEGQAYGRVLSDQNSVELYKNQSTQTKDLVITNGKKRYILFGYDYVKDVKEGRYFPSKIDVYTYSLSDRKLIAKYEGTLR